METSHSSSDNTSTSTSTSTSSSTSTNNNNNAVKSKDIELLQSELFTEVRLCAPGGRLSPRLRKRIQRFPLSVRKEVVSKVRDGCAPLFIACRRGNLEIVEYLINNCGADIEQRGLYEVPDDRSMHFVSPLWCAAVSGRLDIIKCLVKNGADVNADSDSGSTPVRSACFMTHLEIVKFLVNCGADISRANYNGGTCLINSIQSADLCIFLLQKGAEVNATDIQNKTALHYAIQEHRIETTKLLLDYGADPYIVSRFGDDALQTACLKGASQIFKLLRRRVHYSTQRLADAYELMGSTLLDDFNDIVAATTYWRIAINIRRASAEYIQKLPTMPPRAAYRHAVEFNSNEELDAIITDIDAMRMQSLLICERVLGPEHKDAVFRLMYRGASYADALRFQRCIDLWMWALKIRIDKDTILFTDTCYAAQGVVKVMVDMKTGRINFPGEDFSTSRNRPRFCDVVEIFKMLVDNIKETRHLLDIRPFYKKQSEMFDNTLKCITHLIYLLIETAQTEDNKIQVNDLVTDLIKMNMRSAYTGDTLLHLSVSQLNMIRSAYFADDTDDRRIFPHLGVVKLLLDCGSNVNAKNESKSTPLHVASIPYNFSAELINLLLSYGAHVDQPNRVGDSPAFLISMNPRQDISLLNHMSLKCLAANIVVKKNIPYENGQIPETLVHFVKFHEP